MVEIEAPYILANYQVQNLVRFCETVLKFPPLKTVLTTSNDEDTDIKELAEHLDELKQRLIGLDVELEVKINENLHGREARIDNGWVTKVGLGSDFFQKPDSWFGIGVTDLTLRKCLETKVDVFRE